MYEESEKKQYTVHMNEMGNMMKKLAIDDNIVVLSKHLYLVDEVCIMCVLSLLKNSKSECLFWFMELYSSGFELNCFKVLYKTYLLFYAQVNPKFEKVILKKFHGWCLEKDKKFDSIAEIINNMVLCKFTYVGFVMYCSIKEKWQSKSIPMKGRKPKFVEEYDEKYHKLLIALNKRNLCNICYELRLLEEEKCVNDSLCVVLIDFYSKTKGITFNDTWKSYLNEFKKNTLDNEVMKYVLHVINISEISVNDVNLKKQYILLNVDIQNYIDELMNYNEIKTYEILKKKRLYGINNTIGCFKLKRHCLKESLRELLAFKPLYSASFSPFWRNLLDQFDENWKYNHDRRTIIFSSSEIDEEFNEKFNLEHDEQSTETQEKSILNLDKKNIYSLLDEIANSKKFINTEDISCLLAGSLQKQIGNIFATQL